MDQNHFKAIVNVIQSYFDGIFNGDIRKLEACFHPLTALYGDIKGAEYRKGLAEYLDGVSNRKSPYELDEEFRMKILGIELLNGVAIAKLHVPMLGYNYYDYLSLSLVNGKWLIVNKVFTHVD